MEIIINNKLTTIQNPSLTLLVEDLFGDKTKGIAIAVNQNIIPKTEWQNTVLKEQDKIMIIKATQGG